VGNELGLKETVRVNPSDHAGGPLMPFMS